MNAMQNRRIAILVLVLIASLVILALVLSGYGTSTSPLDYAADTWNSFVAMKPPSALLPADNMSGDGVLSEYTSPTNIASYIWSALAARDLGIISPVEARERIAQILQALTGLERHAESGQFYNWYHPVSGEMLTIWPPSGDIVCPFLSSVDNGWLGVALVMVKNAIPELAGEAQGILDAMDFGFYYDQSAGLLRGGYWPPEVQPADSDCSDGYTGHHYGTLNSEPRITSYIAIAMGQVPPSHYYKMWRTFPASCDWGWHEMLPEGVETTYSVADSLPGEPVETADVVVYEGHYTYRGMHIVPSWGGSMFEALMPNLFVPEALWGANSWGVNHPLYVRAQIEHGMDEAQYGYWGFSPASEPPQGYREYGVDALGMSADGYASDQTRTYVDYGFGDCPGREPQSMPEASDYAGGVVTPHAVFLALEFVPDTAFENLDNLRANFHVYHDDYGFYDAVQVDNGVVAEYFLALDQGMIMAALANHLGDGSFRNYFASEIETIVRPLLNAEIFTAGT